MMAVSVVMIVMMRVVRMNDGNDSLVQFLTVIVACVTVIVACGAGDPSTLKGCH